MDKRDAPEQASPEDEERIDETPAVFANKIYVSPLPGGAKITFAEARRSRRSAPPARLDGGCRYTAGVLWPFYALSRWAPLRTSELVDHSKK